MPSLTLVNCLYCFLPSCLSPFLFSLSVSLSLITPLCFLLCPLPSPSSLASSIFDYSALCKNMDRSLSLYYHIFFRYLSPVRQLSDKTVWTMLQFSLHCLSALVFFIHQFPPTMWFSSPLLLPCHLLSVQPPLVPLSLSLSLYTLVLLCCNNVIFLPFLQQFAKLSESALYERSHKCSFKFKGGFLTFSEALKMQFTYRRSSSLVGVQFTLIYVSICSMTVIKYLHYMHLYTWHPALLSPLYLSYGYYLLLQMKGFNMQNIGWDHRIRYIVDIRLQSK